MPLYVFFHASTLDKKVVVAAKRTVVSLGANVLRTAAGSMLVEASEKEVEQLAEALPGWRWSIERKSHRIPERGPLHRPRK